MKSAISPTIKKPRFIALDYLRGFFIVVIIIDHLWLWPSLFTFVTGEGRLWVTAGEGFVIISGLLVGYIRGYKNRDMPLLEVSKKLWQRALLLYGWLIGISLLYTALIWYIPTVGSTTWIEIPKGDWWQLVSSTVLTIYQHDWIHFLYFYALLLAVTPAVIYLLRKKQAIAVVLFTFAGYVLGRVLHVEWMQWMPMFFLPAIAGFYLPVIQSWWSSVSLSERTTWLWLLYSSVGLTIIASVICIFIIPSDAISITLNHLFSKEFYFPVARIPIALLWFVGFVMVFHYFQEYIGKFLGWLFLLFGTRSLTAYILHGAILFIIALLIPETGNFWYNTAIGTLAVIATWLLVRQRLVQKIIPQ